MSAVARIGFLRLWVGGNYSVGKLSDGVFFQDPALYGGVLGNHAIAADVDVFQMHDAIDAIGGDRNQAVIQAFDPAFFAQVPRWNSRNSAGRSSMCSI